MKSAVPTEYKGVRFKSKSEAMFAAYFRTMYYPFLTLFYEPLWAKTETYQPDFVFACKHGDAIALDVIEYKPRLPTETYLENLKEGMSQIITSLKSPATPEVNAYVYHGTFFDLKDSIKTGLLKLDVDKRIWAKEVYETNCGIDLWTWANSSDIIKEVCAIRFDLPT